jgi:hypothetical protein
MSESRECLLVTFSALLAVCLMPYPNRLSSTYLTIHKRLSVESCDCFHEAWMSIQKVNTIVGQIEHCPVSSLYCGLVLCVASISNPPPTPLCSSYLDLASCLQLLPSASRDPSLSLHLCTPWPITCSTRNVTFRHEEFAANSMLGGRSSSQFICNLY